jgi:FemAB-related protein (PEP-CTERM system-associated)
VAGTLEVRSLEDGDRERWDAFVRATPDSHFGQLIAWRDVVEQSYGCRPLYRLALEKERVRGVLPVFRKRRTGRPDVLFSAPGGLLADGDDAAQALLDAARELLAREEGAYLELRDQRHRWPGLATSEEHATLLLDLAPTPEAQWERFDPKLRNQIRKGERSGFALRQGGVELVGDFYRVLRECMRDLGTPVLGEDHFRRVLERLGSAARVLVIEREGAPVGTMLLVAHAGGLADPWAASLRRHFPLCPNQVLYWAAIRVGIAQGLGHFDLGRSQWDSGTFRFKRQWGARPVPLYYQILPGGEGAAPSLEERRRSFALAVRIWRRLPLAAAGWLGGRVRRLFPEEI